MAKNTNKKKSEYEAMSSDEARKLALEELPNFKKIYGIDVLPDLKSVYGSDDKIYDSNEIPDFLKDILEQYYMAALVMVPNACRLRPNAIYSEINPGIDFTNTRYELQKRIENAKTEIETILKLHKKIESVPDVLKKLYITYIKLLETDLINNIAHIYDVQEEREVTTFERNFSPNGHLLRKTFNFGDGVSSNDRLKAINTYIRNTIKSLDQKLGNQEKKDLDLGRFVGTFVIGARGNLRRLKDNNILDLVQGDYDVTPVLVKGTPQNGASKSKNDHIMFVGKGHNISVADWHLGVGELLHSSKLSHLIPHDASKLNPIITRARTNRESIFDAINVAHANTAKADYSNASMLEKMVTLSYLNGRLSQVRKKLAEKKEVKEQDRAVERQFSDAIKQLKTLTIPNFEKVSFSPESKQLLNSLNLNKILDYLEKQSIDSKER